jgi:hypothetical protein
VALMFIGVAAVVLIIDDFRATNDRTDDTADDGARGTGNDRARSCSDRRTCNGAIACDDTLFRTRKRRGTGYSDYCHDSERELLHLILSLTDAAWHRNRVRG